MTQSSYRATIQTIRNEYAAIMRRSLQFNNRVCLMRLYYSPGACSLASNITFAEAGQAYDLCRVDLGKHLTEDGRDFYAINPKGYVPYLELADGQSISEGAAILQFIADSNPSANLAPAPGTMARVKLNEWLTYINSEVHKTLGGMFDRSMPADYRAGQIEKAGKRFDLLSATLSKQDYLSVYRVELDGNAQDRFVALASAGGLSSTSVGAAEGARGAAQGRLVSVKVDQITDEARNLLRQNG
jgi:glutathione S-transferase